MPLGAESSDSELMRGISDGIPLQGGKLLGRDNGPAAIAQVMLAQNENSWDLLIEKDGEIGVAAHGPIKSLPVIVQLLELAGAKPKRATPKTEG